jgi:ABC-type multidrug transport system ATPase subunit
MREKDRVRRLLGYLPQEFGVYPRITAEALLRHFAALKGIEPRRLDEVVAGLLHKTNLWDVRKRKLGTFSGGMKQRFGIAQALIGDPRLIIVDEPTAGLDPEERLRFYHLLAELAENRIVLLSTHIVEDVAVLCPQFAVIRAGRLVASTTPRAARAAIEGAIFEGTVSPSELPDLRQSRSVTQAILVEGRHRVRVFAPDGSPPLGFERVTPTLEDAYLVLMRSGLPGLGGDESGDGVAASAVDSAPGHVAEVRG